MTARYARRDHRDDGNLLVGIVAVLAVTVGLVAVIVAAPGLYAWAAGVVW